MPSVEPSSDLFDGDILGDELIDIYNAAVVGGADDDDMNGKFQKVTKLPLSIFELYKLMYQSVPIRNPIPASSNS